MIQASQHVSQTRPKLKFYVQSGDVCWTLLATSPGVAALQLVQKTLGSAVISHQKITGHLQMIDRLEVERLAEQLGLKIHVCETGFGTSEAGLFETDEIINCWLKQMSAIENLLRKISG